MIKPLYECPAPVNRCGAFECQLVNIQIMKIPKFLIAENPLVDINRVYVIHTRFPHFIARLEDDQQNFTIAWIESNEMDVMRMASLMRRLGDWYVTYCNWEDNHYNSEDSINN